MRIVEIGPGALPAFEYSSKLGEEVDLGATYVGIDIALEEIASIQPLYKQKYEQERVWFVAGDLGKVPLEDNVADEIWLLNVFSGRLVIKPDKLPDGKLRSYLGLGRYFEELVRILRPGGTIFIGEWAPRVHNHNIEWLMEANYEQYGLSKKVYTGEALQDFMAQQQRIRCVRLWKDTPPFFITLTKTDYK